MAIWAPYTMQSAKVCRDERRIKLKSKSTYLSFPFHVSDPAGANVIVPRVHTIILGTFGTICETSIDSLCAAGLHIRHDIPVLWRDLQRQLLLDLHTASCMHARKCHTASLPPHGPGPPSSGVG